MHSRCGRCGGSTFPDREDREFVACLQCGHRQLAIAVVPRVPPADPAPGQAPARTEAERPDDGCVIAPSCLTCPLQVCVNEVEPRLAQQIRNAVMRLRGDGRRFGRRAG